MPNLLTIDVSRLLRRIQIILAYSVAYLGCGSGFFQGVG